MSIQNPTKEEQWKKTRESVDKVFSDTSEARQKMGKHLQMYQNKYWDKSKLNEWNSEITYNLAFATVEAQAPMLTDNDPIVTLVPEFPFLENLAEAYNRAIRYFWRKSEMKEITCKVVKDAMIMNLGIFKVYWGKDQDEVSVDAVDPRNFFIAPGYDDIWEAPFCGVRESKPMSWVRETFPKRYEKVKPESSVGKDFDVNRYKYSDAIDSHTYFVTIYEVWMKDDTMITEDIEGEKGENATVEKPKFPYGKLVYGTKDVYLGEIPCTDAHGKPPYIAMRDYINPHEFLGIGEIDNISGACKEINLLLQAIVDYVRRYLYENYELDVNSCVDPELVKANIFKGLNVFEVDKRQSEYPVVVPVPTAPINDMVVNFFMMIPKLTEEISGITDIAKGDVSKKQRQSASEIAMLLESAHTRTRQKVRNLESALKRLIYIIVRLMQQYYVEPRMIANPLSDESGYEYEEISNSLAAAAEIIAPSEERDNAKKKSERRWTPGEAQMMQDYYDFVRIFGEPGSDEAVDPIYFNFEVQIDTNSTLPLDKQSLANLMIRLLQMRAVDRQAVLETLKVPNAGEILKRMDAEEEKDREAKANRPKPPSPQGGNPMKEKILAEVLERKGGQ